MRSLIEENLEGKQIDRFFNEYELVCSETELELLVNGDKAAEIRFHNYVNSRDDLIRFGEFYYDLDEVVGLIERFNNR